MPCPVPFWVQTWSWVLEPGLYLKLDIWALIKGDGLFDLPRKKCPLAMSSRLGLLRRSSAVFEAH